VAGAGAAAAAAIGYSDRGATTNVDVSVTQLADATELAFRDLGITLTEREADDEGIELQGSEGDWKIVVDIERDADDVLTEVEVTVSQDLVNYEKSRAEEILRAILNRA
jgi:ribulose 1,5-bisphosphate synthetase/thiazole synthase